MREAMGQESTKKCPFCGEIILAEAIKCRFCKEFLVNADGSPVSYHDRRIQPPTVTEPGQRQDAQQASSYRPPVRQNGSSGERVKGDAVLYTGSPSLWGLAGMFAMTALVVFVGGLLIFYPVGNLILKLVPNATEQVLDWVNKIKGAVGMILVLIFVLKAFYKAVDLKRIRYEVTQERIEFARGIFSRKIDNVDMFRIVDIKLHRSLMDCIVGVGAVTLTTKDESDPVFEFKKVPDPKNLYDVIKKASLQADRRQGVIHVD